LSGKFFYPQPKCLPLLDIASQCPSLPLYCKQNKISLYLQYLKNTNPSHATKNTMANLAD
ncbi:hypothetical protein AB7317_16475, partial [Providencia huaxiensis]